jgi:hypothetical protein
MEHDTGSGAGQSVPPGAPEQADPAATSATASTGEPRVDAAVLRLAELDDLPLSEHPAVYERVHEELVEVLGELHAGRGQPGQGQPAQGEAGRAGSRREDT